MSIEIISEKAIPMADLKEKLKKIKERDKELNFRANKVEEYLDMFVKMKEKDAEGMIKKLEALNIPRLKPEHIVKIIDLMPETVDDLKVILQGYTLTVNKENMAKIVEVVKEFLPKKK